MPLMSQGDASALQHAQPSEDALSAQALQVLKLWQAIHHAQQLQPAYEVENLHS